ncbi:MAG: phosphatidate cytidylyltransferase [Candidatus Eiseniibacteriota bacterium]|jgi:phosphatidate cytidylyltransferase
MDVESGASAEWSDGAPAPRAAATHGGALRARVVSAVIFLPILIVVVRLGGLAFVGLVGLMVLLGLVEFYGMLQSKGERPYRLTGIVAGLALVWYAHVREGIHANLLLTAVLLGVMVVELFRRDNRGALHNIAGTVFGVFYVAWLGSHLVFLQGLPLLAQNGAGASGPTAQGLVYFLFLIVWGCDTGAYAVGTLCGRHRLLPRVSPKKSVEGAIGGLVVGALLGALATFGFARFLDPWFGALLGLALAAAGQVGDMVESLLKRDTARKDSAVTMAIPGHGGVLDRFDSVLFAAPVFYYILKAIYL